MVHDNNALSWSVLQNDGPTFLDLSGCLPRAYLRERGRKHNHFGDGRFDAGVCAQHVDGAREERGLIGASNGSAGIDKNQSAKMGA